MDCGGLGPMPARAERESSEVMSIIGRQSHTARRSTIVTLGHPDSLAAILRAYFAEDYGEDCAERLIKAASEYPMTFKHYLRLYYQSINF